MPNELESSPPDHLLVDAFERVLDALRICYGLDTSNPNFKETPQRMARAYAEIFSGLKDTEEQLTKVLAASFPCESETMVIQKDILVYSVCPHHFLPVEMNIALAYIPSNKGVVLGLSKLSRLAEILAKRPVLQEQLSLDITSALMKLPGCQGAIAVVTGKHYCMTMRGAKQPRCTTITPSIKGIFETDNATRAEFYSLLKT